ACPPPACTRQAPACACPTKSSPTHRSLRAAQPNTRSQQLQTLAIIYSGKARGDRRHTPQQDCTKPVRQQADGADRSPSLPTTPRFEASTRAGFKLREREQAARRSSTAIRPRPLGDLGSRRELRGETRGAGSY